MSRGKRYETESKLNIKKVFAVIIAIAVLIMFVIGIKTLLTTDTQEKLSISSYYYSVYTNGKWGVIDQTGKIIIEPTMEEMITIPDNNKDIFICITDVDYTNNTYKTKVLNAKKQEIFTQYDEVQAIENNDENQNLWYEEGVLKVRKGELYGLINFSGKEILKPEYQEIKALDGVRNSIIIKKEDKYGVSDNQGNIIIQPEYMEIKAIENNYQNGYIVVNQNQKYGMIDFNRTVILENKYEDIKQLAGDNVYIVKDNGKYKAINKEGQILVENKFDDVKQIDSENITIIKDKKYGVINTSGEEKIKPQYQDLKYMFDNYYIAKKNGKYGIINLSNETNIEFKYSKITYRKESGIIELEKSGISNVEILNSKFEKKLEGIIEEVNIEKGYFKIRMDDGYHYYNFNFEEKNVQEILTDRNLFLSKKDDKYGYVDKENNVVVDHIYEEATEFNIYGYAAVKKDGKWGSINNKGKQEAQTTYELADNIIIDFIGKWHLGQDLNIYYYTDK